MKIWKSVYAFILLIFTSPVFSDVLTTRNYVITITSHCEEGNVSCDNVSYQGISRKSGNEITLKGKTKHSRCSNSNDPCRFIGYEFNNGDITYLVLESGLLQVIRGENEMLVEEKGVWTY